MKIILQKAKIENIPVLIEIEKSAPSKIYSAMLTEKEWKSELAKENSTIYAIIMEGEIVGDISYEMKNKNVAYISGLCVSSKYKGQGIGKEAIRILLEDLKEVKVVELLTHPDNAAAIYI